MLNTKTLIFIGTCLVLLAFITSVWIISISNTEIKLREKIYAQQELVQAYYTKLWEIIKTKAKVADEYAEKFKEIQVDIMTGRYQTGGDLMKWVQEANPNFDQSLYKDLMNSIEGQREGFFLEQAKLRDMTMTHSILLKSFPTKLIVGDREPIKVIILKNEATKSAYETETDSSPELF